MKRLIPLFTLVAIVAFACAKPEPESFQFRITVVNEEGIPIQNASVHATAPVINALPDFKGFTGVDGVFRIDNEDVLNYGLPAVLQVTAEKGSNPPVVFGCGYLKLVRDSVAELTVVLLPYTPGGAEPQ